MPYPNGVTLDIDFTQSTLGGMTFARASGATDGFYTDATGSGYNTFANDVPRYSSTWGLISETQARTNYLLNSTAPATQTVTLTTGPVAPHCLWVIGTGSAAITAGTGTATGLGTATAGSPVFFTVTLNGTFTVTVTGTLTRFQLEKGGSPTSFIVTAGATATRAAETCTMAVGAWYTAGVGTLICDCSWASATAISNSGVVALDDGTINNRITNSQNTFPQFLITAAAVQQVNANIPSISIAIGTNYRIGQRWSSSLGTERGASNGVLAASEQTGKTIPTITQLSIVLGATANLGATIRIRRIQYWPFAMSDADLIAATSVPPIAAVSATGAAGTPSGRSTLSGLNVRPSARGRGGAAQAGAMRSLIPPTFAVVFARARGGYTTCRNTASFLANSQAVGRSGSAKARSARSRALSSVAAAGAAKPKSLSARATFPQSVGARGKANAKSRAFGAGTFSFSARGKAGSPKGRITKFSPAAAGHAGRAKGRIRPTMTAGVGARSRANLRGDPVIAPIQVVTFWQRLNQVTPQHQLSEKTRVIPNKFGDGYQQTVKDGLTPIDRTLTLTWNPLERGDADAMLLFFRTYAGVPLTFVAPRDTGPRHWLAISWQRTSPQPHADGVTVEFQERLYVERSLYLHIAGSGGLV